jgi:hypothetical protein
MLSASMNNSNLMDRSISLAKVLWFGVPWLRGSFIALVCLWALVYLVDYATTSAQIVASVMIAPIMLQTLLGMYIAARAGQLLMNSQLHLVGIRKEIFLNCFTLCLFFVVLVYDPKNTDYLLHAKLIMFAVFSAASFWLFWIYCLQIVPMIVVVAMVAVAVGLGFVVGVKTALVVFDVALWVYFAYWLWRSPLQRQFKFESFTGFVDYCVERLKIASLQRALTQVKNKEHTLLMGEGDGYLNRIILAPIFSVVFTGLYVMAMQHWRELSLWLILLLLGGTKAKVKVAQSSAKLWLLSASDRAGQFESTENISLRLNLYSFLVASLLLVIWLIINPALVVNGIAALCLSLLFVTLVDYYSGLLFPSNKAPFIVLLFVKVAFMLAVTFARFDITWYVLIAAILLMLCIFFRQRAKRNFLVANLSVRAS